jgi:micrococcal nuclease
MRIVEEHLALFPDLKIYIGKRLEIRGWATKNKDHYFILVHYSNAIILL